MDNLLYKINMLGLTENDIKEVVKTRDTKLLDVILEHYGVSFFYQVISLIEQYMDLNQYVWLIERKIVNFSTIYILDRQIDSYFDIHDAIKIKIYMRVIICDRVDTFYRYYKDLTKCQKQLVVGLAFILEKPKLKKYLLDMNNKSITTLANGLSLKCLGTEIYNYELIAVIYGNWKILNQLLQKRNPSEDYINKLIKFKKNLDPNTFENIWPNHYSKEKTLLILSSFVSP